MGKNCCLDWTFLLNIWIEFSNKTNSGLKARCEKKRTWYGKYIRIKNWSIQ
jgi:hypothetical protein